MELPRHTHESIPRRLFIHDLYAPNEVITARFVDFPKDLTILSKCINSESSSLTKKKDELYIRCCNVIENP